MRRVVYMWALLLVAVGCKESGVDERVEEPTLRVDIETLELDYTKQSLEIAFESNQEVDVKEEVLWIAVNGVDAGVIRLTVQENSSESGREADVVITVGELSHKVHIVQMAKPPKSEVMELKLGHSDSYLDSPKWGGDVVSGTIDWGDGITEEYAEGASHDYASAESRTAIFRMEGATSFEIERIGSMETLSISVE